MIALYFARKANAYYLALTIRNVCLQRACHSGCFLGRSPNDWIAKLSKTKTPFGIRVHFLRHPGQMAKPGKWHVPGTNGAVKSIIGLGVRKFYHNSDQKSGYSTYFTILRPRLSVEGFFYDRFFFIMV